MPGNALFAVPSTAAQLSITASSSSAFSNASIASLTESPTFTVQFWRVGFQQSWLTSP